MLILAFQRGGRKPEVEKFDLKLGQFQIFAKNIRGFIFRLKNLEEYTMIDSWFLIMEQMYDAIISNLINNSDLQLK